MRLILIRDSSRRLLLEKISRRCQFDAGQGCFKGWRQFSSGLRPPSSRPSPQGEGESSAVVLKVRATGFGGGLPHKPKASKVKSSPARGFFLSVIQAAEMSPERLDCAVAIFHRRCGGGVSCNAASMSTKRLSAAAFIPSLKDSGTQESSCSMTNLTTCARSAADNPLICSMTSAALIL